MQGEELVMEEVVVCGNVTVATDGSTRVQGEEVEEEEEEEEEEVVVVVVVVVVG